MTAAGKSVEPPHQLLRMLLRPLLKFLLGQSYTSREIVSVLKEELVVVAKDELLAAGKKANASRVALLTGLDRRDVKKLLLEHDVPPKRPVVSPMARVIGQWTTSADFTTSNGKPRVLKLNDEIDEFTELVNEVSTEYYAGTMLKEMLRLGIVEQSARGVRLVREQTRLGFGMSEEEGFEMLARDMESLIQAVKQNVLEKPEPANCHSRTAYDNIYYQDLPIIRSWLLAENKKFHGRARQFLSKFDADLSPASHDADSGAEVVLTSFSITSKNTELFEEDEEL